MMLVDFLIAAGAGVAIGFFFRVAALIAASIAFLIYAAAVPNGRDALSAIAISLALLTTLQAGYICGLALSSLSKKIQRSLKQRYNDRATLSASAKHKSNQSELHTIDFK
jgi:hypothetical protein